MIDTKQDHRRHIKTVAKGALKSLINFPCLMLVVLLQGPYDAFEAS